MTCKDQLRPALTSGQSWNCYRLEVGEEVAQLSWALIRGKRREAGSEDRMKVSLERSSRGAGVAGPYGRTNLTLRLEVEGQGKEEGEKWKCGNDVGAGATRSGEPLWPDKPGSVVGDIESEYKVNDFESMEIVVGRGSLDQEWRAFMVGQTWSELVQTYRWREGVCIGEKLSAETRCVKPLRRFRTGIVTGRK